MDIAIQIVTTIVCACIASSGFWAFIQKRKSDDDSVKTMLIGLGHDRITHLGMVYVDKGEITEDEYENLHDYLYVPYLEMGGNGSAKRVMSEVDKLPIKKNY